MMVIRCVMISLLVVLVGGLSQAQPQREPPALVEWVRLVAVAKKLEDAPGSGGQSYRIDRKEQVADFTRLVAIVADELPTHEAFLADVTKKYGNEPRDISTGVLKALDFETRQKAGTLSEVEKKLSMQPGEAAASIRQYIPRMRKSRDDSVAVSLKNLNEKLDFAPNYREDIRVKEVLNAKTHLELLQRYYPENQDLAAAIKKADKVLETSAAAVAKAVAGRSFPKGAASFAGPGKTEDLIEAAFKYFRSSKRWTGNDETVLAVVVLGDWFTASKHPVTDQPIQFGLPVAVALARKGDAKVAWVYESQLLTEMSLTPAKAVPFVAHRAVVRPDNPSMMLADNIPAAVRAK